MVNAQNTQYVNLRNQAIVQGDLAHQKFSNSQAAYSAGNGGEAKKLSLEAHEHQRQRDNYNHQAAQWIYDQNNAARPAGEIDLHGLYVSESIEFAEKAITVRSYSHVTAFFDTDGQQCDRERNNLACKRSTLSLEGATTPARVYVDHSTAMRNVRTDE